MATKSGDLKTKVGEIERCHSDGQLVV